MTQTIRPSSACFRTRTRSKRRGIAEIELLLCAGTLMLVMFLVVASFRVQRARQEVAIRAQQASLARATEFRLLDFPDIRATNIRAIDPQIDGLPDIVAPLNSLPNTSHGHRETRVVALDLGRDDFIRPAIVSSHAVAPGAAWTWPGWPLMFGNRDRTAIRDWFHTTSDNAWGDVSRALRLQD